MCIRDRCQARAQNFGSSIEVFHPIMFCNFKHYIPALKFKHCSGFSCPNTSVFDLLSSLCVTENTIRFENYFSEAVEKCADVLVSDLLIFFRIICGRYQAIDIFCEALVTVPMITIVWLQFLRHLVACIFQSVCRVGRFLTSPSADILKLLHSVLRSVAKRKIS